MSRKNGKNKNENPFFAYALLFICLLVVLRFRNLIFNLAVIGAICFILYKYGGSMYYGMRQWLRRLDGKTVGGKSLTEGYSEKKIAQYASHISDIDGFQYEEYVAERMKKNGYSKVTVTKKSGDYGADVIATGTDGRRICVQCKKYRAPVGVKAVQEIFAAKTYYRCDRAAVITTSTFTEAARRLAKKTSVKLVERDEAFKL